MFSNHINFLNESILMKQNAKQNTTAISTEITIEDLVKDKKTNSNEK